MSEPRERVLLSEPRDGTSTRQRWDWDGIRAQLAAAEAALASTEPSEAERDAIFARRAEALAAPISAGEPTDALPSLVFRLGGEQYAVPGWQVREVRPIGQLTPLPGTPPFVAGLVNVRGRVVTALDLRPVIGLRTDGEAPNVVMLMASPGGDVGVLVSEQPTLRWLREGDLGPLPPGGPAGLDPAFVRGVTRDLVVVLDAERLLADQRLLVRDDA
jgi:purine-binding chemotaxis protein CheW